VASCRDRFATKATIDTPESNRTKSGWHRKGSELVDEVAIESTLAQNFGRISAAHLLRAHAAIESGRARGKIGLEGF
jgi:hypothetical protein